MDADAADEWTVNVIVVKKEEIKKLNQLKFSYSDYIICSATLITCVPFFIIIPLNITYKSNLNVHYTLFSEGKQWLEKSPNSSYRIHM